MKDAARDSLKDLPEFPLGEDGFPIPGQVIRYYRERMLYPDRTGKIHCWSQADLAKRLKLSELSVRYMETRNTGLDSIERRRVLASLLKIPPVLLGLAPIADLPENINQHVQIPINLKNNHANIPPIQLYKDAFSVYSFKHNTHTAQDVLVDINQWIARIQADLAGANHQQNLELLSVLWNFHALSAKIYGEDSCQWLPAFEHLNAALDIATSLNKPDLQASSLYRSSAVYFAQKNFALAKSTIDGALLHSRKAQEYIRGAVYADAALIYAASNNDMGNVTYAQQLLDQAESCVNTPSNDGIMNFSDGKYQLIKARTLITLSRPGKALECLDDAEVDIMPNERRRLAFLNILRAECYTTMKRAEYDRAVNLLIESFNASNSIKSVFNVNYILRLHKLIAASPYGNAPDVVELGMQLRKLQLTR